MRSFDYRTVDVFTSERFGGNPLAVIPDARGLSSEEMQAITREFNYSESTFVLPPKDAANTAQVRIFTPASEIPFAGHPNVGTAYVLAQLAAVRGEAPESFRFEEGAGLVEIEVLRSDGDVVGARIRAPQRLKLGVEVEAADVAACLGLEAADIVTRHHAPVEAGVGLSFIFAEVSSPARLAAVECDLAAFARANARYNEAGLRFSIFAYARLGDGPERLRARMFGPLTRVPEDPATGSASCAMGALLASLEKAPDGELNVAIDQGVEMGRPSRLEVTAIRRGGQVVDVRVAGSCVSVMQGALSL
jgi:trans-2,3-dihydro-3-hydroxyanthranilate isomerase